MSLYILIGRNSYLVRHRNSKVHKVDSTSTHNSAIYRMHEFLRETNDWKYQVCDSCSTRSLFVCIICSFCWSCHWKIEQLAKIPYHMHNEAINLRAF